MSTEHQRYSTKNQAAAIARYARRRNYDVVKTYSDDGISGLRFKNREGLKSLLADAVSGEAGFDLILVYDVSRWGRFQNPDQAAHYEFLCAEAGVRVEYCAEIFENDGSLASIMLKNLKRGMAAEFSRDLSVKVAAGKTRLAAKGYWQSGPPGLGLRRTVVDERGHPVVELKPGERKAVQAHRVILTPGPADEIALVNRIYRLFAVQGLTRRAIVRLLNAEGRPTDRGRAWTQATLDSLLSNPKYTGDLRYNRINCRLGVTTRLPR
jgi:DNA invertase Pin-like site-specific DNA recombinase